MTLSSITIRRAGAAAAILSTVAWSLPASAAPLPLSAGRTTVQAAEEAAPIVKVRKGRNAAAIAAVAGVTALGVGAAIASRNQAYGYGYGNGYYAQPAPGYGYYNQGYVYDDPGYYEPAPVYAAPAPVYGGYYAPATPVYGYGYAYPRNPPKWAPSYGPSSLNFRDQNR